MTTATAQLVAGILIQIAEWEANIIGGRNNAALAGARRTMALFLVSPVNHPRISPSTFECSASRVKCSRRSRRGSTIRAPRRQGWPVVSDQHETERGWPESSHA